MSIRRAQIENTIGDLTRIFYSQGRKPTLASILEATSEYFSAYPAGVPIPLPLDDIRGKERSDVDAMNIIMNTLQANLELAYEVSQEQVAEIMELTTALRTYIDRLKAQRRRVEAQIDDYLLSLYNSDGYFYSISDIFSDLELVDLTMTTAYVNIQAGVVQLPTVSSLSRVLEPREYSAPIVQVKANNTSVGFKTVGPWSNAIDGLTNTVWSIEVEVDSPQEVVCDLKVPFAKQTEITRVDVDPYGISSAQYFIKVGVRLEQNINDFDFGSLIKKTTNRFSFANTAVTAENITLTIRKVEPDYIETVDGVVKYRYLFGLKDLLVTKQFYDNSATLVSAPLTISEDLQNEIPIDAISLTVDADIPPGTSIDYFITEDTGGTALGDFVWRQITPLDAISGGAHVLRFNGSRNITQYIRSTPTGSDLELIDPDSTNTDLTKRNPSPSIIEGVDVYRLAAFTAGDVLLNSVQLEEGVNTVRIYHQALDSTATDSLDFWATNLSSITPVYGRIDVGNDFFYGGDVGDSGRSVYVETFVHIDDETQPVVAEFRKSDNNSQSWTVRVFLNGRDVGYLPVGVDKMIIPWPFQQGANHIALVINIPAATEDVPNPYIGTLDLLGGIDLFSLGTVKLATWNYVDFFNLKYNQTNAPYTFSLHNDEIVSRRQPTTNFRIRYSTSTNQGPAALRFRADLSRDSDGPTITPSVSSYRLRFAFGE
jgi:hypothetical protein